MNWTEGSLARHSRGRSAKETILRQKQHFAKVRSGLSSSNVRKSPVAISFLGHISSSHPSPRPSLEREALPHGQDHDSLSAPSRKRRRISSSRGHDELHFNPLEPTFTSQQEGKVLDESRRRLLQKSDWVGISIQKPLDLQFSVPTNTPGHPWSECNHGHATFRRSARHLIGSRYDQMRKKTQWGDMPSEQTPVHVRDFRIRVGGREVQLAASSSAQVGNAMSPRKKRSRKTAAYKRRRMPQRNPSSSSTREGEPVIYQPIPRRFDVSQLLRIRSADSQNLESTMADIGRVPSPMAPSQIRDNELWKNRISLQDDTNSTTATSSHIARVATRDVSPGISELAHNVATTDGSNGGDTTTYAISSTKESYYSSTSNSPTIQTKGIDTDNNTNNNGLGTSLAKMEKSTLSMIPSAEGQHHHTSVSEIVTEHVCTTSNCSRNLSTTGIQATGSDMHAISEEQSRKLSFPTIGGSNELVTAPMPIPKHTESRILPEIEQQGTMNPHQDLMRADSPEDENEVWKRFVFGLSSDDEERVFEEARRHAARELKPSEASINAYEDSYTERGSNIETGGSSHTDLSEHVGKQEACASHLATIGSSSLASDLSDPSHHNGNLSLDATSVSSEIDMVTLLVPPRVEETGHVDSIASPASEPNSTAVEPPKSLDHEELGFRFAPPRIFVGKLSGTADSSSQHYPAPAPQPKRGRKAKTIRKVVANDGRTDIRALPNYIGDPIEEFDNVRSTRVGKPSLFGELETQ